MLYLFKSLNHRGRRGSQRKASKALLCDPLRPLCFKLLKSNGERRTGALLRGSSSCRAIALCGRAELKRDRVESLPRATHHPVPRVAVLLAPPVEHRRELAPALARRRARARVEARTRALGDAQAR